MAKRCVISYTIVLLLTRYTAEDDRVREGINSTREYEENFTNAACF